jgi:acyl carrier protein
MNKIEILKIISKALGQKVTESSNIKNTKKWDSLGHLQILASLDKYTKGKSSKINKLSSSSSVKEIIKLLGN